MSSHFGSNFKVFVKSEGKGALKEILKECCDSDYNGESGEDYLTEVELDGKKVLLSSFEIMWNKHYDKSEAEIVEEILTDNYFESYYEDQSVNVVDLGDKIVFSVAYMY